MESSLKTLIDLNDHFAERPGRSPSGVIWILERKRKNSFLEREDAETQDPVASPKPLDAVLPKLILLCYTIK